MNKFILIILLYLGTILCAGCGSVGPLKLPPEEKSFKYHVPL